MCENKGIVPEWVYQVLEYNVASSLWYPEGSKSENQWKIQNANNNNNNLHGDGDVGDRMK